ncbi:hypothetical protein BDV95DRAFT_627291 [Massariosphaeria phaeospora]|uniref:Oxysterol-binding protein n=1 Tax=Massariosphaeria phaeospora TaxID=100035 RepID=A0A7C8MA57_9PLEO|nr:hypothetical protein BDV95DRAFT_627291 [Massariosphaeria phaeospora]
MRDSIESNRSGLRQFLGSAATLQGDLSNTTAPPFLLARHSAVELPQYLADRPSLFVAPALEPDAEKRALLVLKRFLSSLKNQQYAGRNEGDGVKKPLNSFLGELFMGNWNDAENGETRVIAEQVSHRPPITACYLWNNKHGVRAEGYTQQETTFSGNVNIKQKGYAVQHIDRYEEDYLLPIPDVQIKSLLSGSPYPELVGKCSIVSSTGLISEVKFGGKGWIGGSKNSFAARLYRADKPSEDIYTANGCWNGKFSIHDARSGRQLETFDVNAEKTTPVKVADISKQDPWESRRAWRAVADALLEGDMKGTSDAKAVIEQGQRTMRKDEEARGEEWKRLFFRRQSTDSVFQKLSSADRQSFEVDPASGMWKVDKDAVEKQQRPYHGNLLPTGNVAGSAEQGGILEKAIALGVLWGLSQRLIY